jgi:uncharacterized membrane protein
MQSTGHRTHADDRGREIVLAAAAMAACFLAGAIAAPTLLEGGSRWAEILHAAYRPLCHQIPSRSFSLGGHGWSVCARCAGLYAGGAAGLALAGIFARWRVRAIPLAWIAVAAFPTLIDVVVHLAGWSGASSRTRFALAFPLGLVAGHLLAVGLADLGDHAWRRMTEPRTC